MGLWKFVRIVLFAVGALAVFYTGLWIYGSWHDDWSGYTGSVTFSDGTCNIAVIPITGDLTTDPLPYDQTTGYTNSDDVLRKFREAQAEEPNIRGVLVRIDSQGGAPVAAVIISDALKRLTLPSVGLIREYGTSGAYLIATGANTIIASPISDVGGIGVTMSYVENVRQNTNTGLDYVQLSSGKYKDAGDPNKPLTPAERSLFDRDLKIVHEWFVNKVAENRRLDVADVAKLADGSSMTGEMALQNKLIDQVGDQETARDWFASELKLAPEDVVFCE